MPAASDKNSVHSLAKGFRVLEAFTAERTEMGLAEVARAAGIDNATAFRFLNTLVQLGYVEKIPEAKRFRLTLKCIDLGFNAIARTDLRELRAPAAARTRQRYDRGRFDRRAGWPDLVYVERVQAGLVRLGVDVRIGSRVPGLFDRDRPGRARSSAARDADQAARGGAAPQADVNDADRPRCAARAPGSGPPQRLCAIRSGKCHGIARSRSAGARCRWHPACRAFGRGSGFRHAAKGLLPRTESR